ncbi:hypothetical protein JST99_01535 [Candidatus Dependentiae bacterium]|nr:hypothetical protein [Candidatus Dependentiae bacterium]MCC7415205.1 hypothetical protein [Campylobacterota bacterium]
MAVKWVIKYWPPKDKHVVVLLTAGDKSTQENDIKIARLRLSEVLERGEELL